MIYRNIIVAVDNDLSDDPVCDRAVAMANACDARLILMHVVEPPIAPVAPGVVGAVTVSSLPSEEEQAERMAEHAAQLDALAARIGDRVIERRVVESPQICDTIHEIAVEFNADLIVVGSHGRHGLSLFVAGSTASDLLKKAPCDILAVRIFDD
jgi:universal stress protein A